MAYDKRDIAAEIQAMLESIKDQPQHIQGIVADIEEMYEETCAYMVGAEESLVRQFAPDYQIDGETALNDLFRASEEKLRFWIFASAVGNAIGDDAQNFPYNFADELKASAKPADRKMPEDMTEHVQAFHDATTAEVSLTLEKGVSVLRNELSALRIRDFSRRIEEYLDRGIKPTLVAE